MRYTLSVSYTGLPSKQFVFDVFMATKDVFSKGFNLEFDRLDNDKTIFTIITTELDDIYLAGMVGAKIEELLNVK